MTKLAAVNTKGKWRPKLVGAPPMCACGCGEPVAVIGRRVSKWRLGHSRRKWGHNRKDAKTFERLFRVYGVTREQYDQMVAFQLGSCAICATDKLGTFRGKTKMWCVDHDHSTNKVRALLCRDCNTAIGLLKENPSLCERAAQYLVFHKGIV